MRGENQKDKSRGTGDTFLRELSDIEKEELDILESERAENTEMTEEKGDCGD